MEMNFSSPREERMGLGRDNFPSLLKKVLSPVKMISLLL
jgi:hypothetical protein